MLIIKSQTESKPKYKHMLCLKSQKNKAGLVAVKKQVTKNGKTFMQTFYIKKKESPKAVVSKESKKSEYLKYDKRDTSFSGIYASLNDMIKSAISENSFMEWARDDCNVYKHSELKRFKSDMKGILLYKLSNAIKYHKSVSEEEAIDKMATRLHTLAQKTKIYGSSFNNESNYFPIFRTRCWLHEKEPELAENGFFPSSFNTAAYSAEVDDQLMKTADIVAYAIMNNLPLKNALQYAKAEKERIEAEISVKNNKPVGFNDSHNKIWDESDAKFLGRWVQGDVKPNREAAKDLFEKRRNGISAATDNEMVQMAESHCSEYTEKSILYRGTKNTKWLEGKIGDTIPVGMAAFSKSKDQADAFSVKVTLILDPVEIDEKHPIAGIDVDDVVKSMFDNGYRVKAIQLGVNAYPDEQEFITVVPAFKIVRREGRLVYVKPVDMDVVEFMKAMLDDRIAAMERSFDYPLHREPDFDDTVLQKAKITVVSKNGIPVSKKNGNPLKGKTGYTPVKKQVTKNGKTFMQTFYVKIKDEAKEVKTSKPEKVKEPVKISDMPDIYNMYDGFFINYEDKAIKMPDEYVVKQLDYAGHSWVLSRSFSGSLDGDSLEVSKTFKLYEQSTGMSVGYGDTKYEAEINAKQIIDSHKKDLDSIIASKKVVGELPKISDTQNVKVDDSGKFLDLDDAKEEAKKILLERGLEDDIDVSKFTDWLMDTEEVTTKGDLKNYKAFKMDNLTTDILKVAMYKKLKYEDARKSEEAIDEIWYEAKNLDSHGEWEITNNKLTRNDISEWADKHENSLTKGIYMAEWGVDIPNAEKWKPIDVVGYAIRKKCSLAYTKKWLEAKLEDEIKKKMPKQVDQTEFTDTYGMKWDKNSVRSIGRWVNGHVEPNRRAARELFENRRKSVEDKGYTDVVKTVETHAKPYTGIIYRGTGNREWLTGEIGDVVPVGMASFSKSKDQADNFSKKVTLIIEPKDVDPTNPVVGVDVCALADAVYDSGDTSFGKQSGVNDYYKEKELILMSPACKILRREGSMVWVQPVEMDLVQFMKALFNDRIEAMGRTFDFHTWDEPEDFNGDSTDLFKSQELMKGKEGKVALKKQVTKNGKTFMQTFWVKPEDVPAADKTKKVEDQKKPRATKVEVEPPKKLSELESTSKKAAYNMKDGFYVSYAEKAIKIPDKYIIKTVDYFGYKWVLARALDDDKMGSNYRMYEQTTGKTAGSAGDTPEDAEKFCKETLNSVGEEKVKSVIDKVQKISEISIRVSGTDNYADPLENKEKTVESEILLSDEDFEKFTTEIWEESELEDENIDLEDFQSWVRNVEGVNTQDKLDTFKDIVMDGVDVFVLQHAMNKELDFEDATASTEAINEILEEIPSSEIMDASDIDFEQVADWAEEFMENLVDGVDVNDWEVESDYGNGWTSADVITKAIINGQDLDDAKDTITTSVEEQNEEMAGGQETEFTDDNGVDWDEDAIEHLGSWVRGNVSSNRKAANDLFKNRRESIESSSGYYGVVEMVETHAKPYEGTLYRGTANKAWLEGEIGDAIPLGIASFSKSRHKADGFSTVVTLIIDPVSIDDENPVVGVDICAVNDAGEMNECGNMLKSSGIQAYLEELELLTMAPACKIISREGSIVHVRPVEMDLVQFMKAMFNDRIARMSKTFDFPMHRYEPKGAFN